MTEQRALEVINEEKEFVEEFTSAIFDEAFEVAIKALEEISLYKQCGLCLIPADIYKNQCEKLDELEEKQTSKKPQKQKYGLLIEDGWEYACPNCKAAVGVNKKDTLGLTQHETYCPECGQKLEWGNE